MNMGHFYLIQHIDEWKLEDLKDLERIKTRFYLAIVPPQECCRGIALLILGDCGSIVNHNGLLPPPGNTDDGIAISESLKQIGQQPFSRYLESEASGAIRRYGFRSTKVIYLLGCNLHCDNVLIVGHPIFIPAIAMMLLPEENPLLGNLMPETKVLIVDRTEQTIKLL